jgi:hypothetical protein
LGTPGPGSEIRNTCGCPPSTVSATGTSTNGAPVTRSAATIPADLSYAVVGKGTFVHPLATERIGTDGRPDPTRGGTAAMADDPDLNRRVAQFLLKQNEIAGRVVDAMMATNVHGMNAATQELADLKAAHQDLAEDIAKYRANAGIEPVDAAPAAPEPAKPRRARKPAK